MSRATVTWGKCGSLGSVIAGIVSILNEAQKVPLWVSTRSGTHGALETFSVAVVGNSSGPQDSFILIPA